MSIPPAGEIGAAGPIFRRESDNFSRPGYLFENSHQRPAIYTEKMVQRTPWEATGGGGKSAVPHLPGSAGVATRFETPKPTPADLLAEKWARVQPTIRAARTQAKKIENNPAVRGQWAYIATGLAHIVIFVLLFQIWIFAKGPDGTAGSNAFGRLEASTRYLRSLSQGLNQSSSHPYSQQVSGSYGLVTAALVMVSIAAIGGVLFTRSAFFEKIVLFATVGISLSVLATMIYFSTIMTDLRGLTRREYDVGGQVASLLNWAFSDGHLPFPGRSENYVATATFEAPAIGSMAIAVGTVFLLLIHNVKYHRGPNVFAKLARIASDARGSFERAAESVADSPPRKQPVEKPPDTASTGSEDNPDPKDHRDTR